MAAPSYTTDLTTLNTGEATTNWSEPGTWTAGGTPVAETDYFIQGTGCISKTFNATSVGGLIFNNGSGLTIPTDGAFLCWQYFGAPNALATEANGGIRLIIGSAATAFKAWILGGSDTYQYGGWQCLAVDPALTPDYTVGSPSSVLQYFGWAAYLVNAVQKGNPFGCDAIRCGRCEARMHGGDLANGYATFSGFAAQNDNVSNRWGLIQAVDGGYLWQGLMTFGYGSAVDFRDSNKQILVANTKKVGANFNKIEIRQASSRVDWTGISFLALGAVSKGRLEVVDDADLNIDSCTFTDMDTFAFKSNSTVLASTFRRCGQITQGSATFTGCLFTASSAAAALLSNNPGAISDCQFISSGTGHAIEITTPGTYTFSGNVFSGYGSDGTTNAAVYNNSGGAVTLNISGGGSTPTVRNGTGASTVLNSSVTVTLTGLKNPSEIRVFNAGTTTERGGTGAENVTSGTHAFSLPAGTAVDISILSLGYQNMRILNYSTTSDTAIPISQVLDRQYTNP